MRVIAIDWSGAVRSAEKKIWLAQVVDAKIIELCHGRNREEILNYLVDVAERDPNLIVGLDFAFSFPAWFVRELGVQTVEQFWQAVETQGETWLHGCAPPFWGHKGTKRHRSHSLFRDTELQIASIGGIRPKSVFQIAGAGAVGTGSIRGIPILRKLRQAGFKVWPFDEPELPLIVEIWPRVLTGPVNKNDPEQRRAHLESRHPDLNPLTLETASSCEDAFDATVSALVMAANIDQIRNLRQPTHADVLLEGWIWSPATQNPALRAPSPSKPTQNPSPPPHEKSES